MSLSTPTPHSRYSRIVLATANPNKVRELTAMLAFEGLELISSRDAGVTDDIEETESTLEGNALLKARTVARLTGLPAIADDTGLEVAALNGAPGVYSARYAGDSCSPAQNRELLLRNMKEVEGNARTAVFRCVLAFVDGDTEHLFEGRVEGRIPLAERGEGGFGYDAVFEVDGTSKTMAELSPAEKNAISHRGRAALRLRTYLESL